MRATTPASFALTALFLLGSTLFCTLPSAHADDTLTLELPPSQDALAARAAARARALVQQAEAAAAARRQTQDAIRALTQPRKSSLSGWDTGLTADSRSSYPSRGASRDERVVGRLGQLARSTSIYRGPSSRTGRLTYAPAGTYLALQGSSGSWYGVLMADGSTGYLHKQNVSLMDYQVVSTGASLSSGSTSGAPLPTHTDEGDIYPRSASPFFTGDPRRLLQAAYKYLGVRYVWGGNTANGIDCSGFIKNVFQACGFPLPRLGSDQMAYGIPVPRDQLQAGDRLYFGRRKERLGVTHTGLYIGGGYFIHSSSSRHGVAISRLDEPMYARMYVCARR